MPVLISVENGGTGSLNFWRRYSRKDWCEGPTLLIRLDFDQGPGSGGYRTALRRPTFLWMMTKSRTSMA